MTPGAIELANPEWLWLLPALAAGALLWRYHGREQHDTGLSGGGGSSRLVFVHPLARLLREVSFRRPGRGLLWTVAIWVSLAGLVLALAQPVRIGEKRPDPLPDRDIVFIVDASVSMMLRDYVLDGERVDRLAVLKGLLDRFAQQMHGDRLSVIVFAESAYTLVPLTRDQGLVRHMLARIQTGVAGRYDAVGEAIALAVKEAGRAPGRRRLLVLFTDVYRPTGAIHPDAAAELAAQAGLPLYTVSIGARGLEAGEPRVSGLIYQPVDVALLGDLAERTGAESFRADDIRGLERALRTIEQRAQEPVARQPRYYREPLYQWPLLTALMVLSAAQLVRNLRGGRHA